MVLNLRRQLPAVPEMLSERFLVNPFLLNHCQLPSKDFQEQLKSRFHLFWRAQFSLRK